MSILPILFAIAAIGFLCWLLFTLAVHALPLFVGVTAGIWAFGAGAGWPGAIFGGGVAAVLTSVVGHLLYANIRQPLARAAIALTFVAPAAIAGFHATHGIVKHATPSNGWQLAFSIMGAAAVGVTALVRVAQLSAARQPDGRVLPG